MLSKENPDMADLNPHLSIHDLPSETRRQAPQSEPVFMKDPVAERHAHDSSSVAIARADQWRYMLGLPATWVLLAATLAVVVGMVIMAFDLHPIASGHVRGPADEGAPNAPLDYKLR